MEIINKMHVISQKNKQNCYKTFRIAIWWWLLVRAIKYEFNDILFNNEINSIDKYIGNFTLLMRAKVAKTVENLAFKPTAWIIN